MKVRELIDFLRHQDQEADVFIEDADTDWHLPVHVERKPYDPEVPPGHVYLWGVYDESVAV